MSSQQAAPADRSMSTADLITQAAAQVSTLVRDELALAKAELTTKGRRAGKGGGLLAGAGALSLYGFGLLLATAVVALDLVWPLWLACLVVALVTFAAAAVAGLLGKQKLAEALPPVPSEAAASVATDFDTVKSALQEGRHS